jgi:flagellar hook-length control protein FliK
MTRSRQVCITALDSLIDQGIVMNLSPISTASSNPPYAEAARGVDSGDTQAFSGVLLQQQGQARGRDMAAIPGAATADTAAADADRHDSLIPDETLALLAAGATLSLMIPVKTVTVDKPGVDTSRTIVRGSSTHDGGTTAQTRAGIDPRSLLALDKVLLDTAAWPEASGHAADPAKAHPLKQARQAIIHQADDATLARINARIAGTSTAADFRSINALDTHPTQPNRLPWLDQVLAAQQAPTVTVPSVWPVAAAAQSTDLPTLQDPSAMPADASLLAGKSLQGQPPSLVMPAVSTPLSNPAWAADFSRQFVALTQGNPTQFHTIEMRLDPPDLGSVRITLHISDSVAQAVFVSPHAVVRQTIENALPQLQQQLAQAGLSLGQANVSDQQPSQQGFQQASSQQGTGNASFFSLSGDANAQDIAPFPVSSWRALRSPDALVDTFA